MVSVDGASGVSGEVASVAGEGQEVAHIGRLADWGSFAAETGGSGNRGGPSLTVGVRYGFGGGRKRNGT